MTYTPSFKAQEQLKYIGNELALLMQEMDKEGLFGENSDNNDTLTTELTFTNQETRQPDHIVIRVVEDEKGIRTGFEFKDLTSDEHLFSLLAAARSFFYDKLSSEGKVRVKALYEHAAQLTPPQGIS